MVLVSSEFSSLLTTPPVYQNRSTLVISAAPERPTHSADHIEELITEAATVGITLMPVFYITESFLMRMFPTMAYSTRTLMAVAVAGSAYHIIAEETGINQCHWYCNHSVAAQKNATNDWAPVADAAQAAGAKSKAMISCPKGFLHLLDGGCSVNLSL